MFYSRQVAIEKIIKLKKTDIVGWLIMAPSLILFGFYLWGPLVESIRLSLYTSKGMILEKFVWFDNYIVVFKHPDFGAAVRNTFYYTIWSLLIGFLIPVITAIILNEIIHFKGFFRVGVYLPNVVPGIATAMMWRFIFRPGSTGILNIILSLFGIPPQVWLSNPKWTIPLIVTTMTWKGAGSTALIYLAALQNINVNLYEAAAIDGASIWKRIWYITIPSIYNLLRTLLILQIIFVFQVFYEPLVMTNGGPNNASISLMQLVYRYAFEKFDYPKAASVSVIIGIMLVILAALYNKVIKQQDV